MTASLVTFSHATRASQGRRARQEDFSALWQPTSDEGTDTPLLVVLADGMGGHVSGQLASRLACERYIDAYAAGAGDIGPRMAHALDASNAALTEAIAQDSTLEGMGCTLVAGHLDADGLRWVSVGDSTLLLYRDGKLHRLNADHSHGALLDKQVAAGIISEQVAQSDGRRRALHSALTGQTIPMQDLELQAYPLMAGDWVIVSSDGLLTLEGNEIATIIHDTQDLSAKDVANRLMSSVEAKHDPRQDNTTIVVVRVEKSSSPGIARNLATTLSPAALTKKIPAAPAAIQTVKDQALAKPIIAAAAAALALLILAVIIF